MYPLLEGSALMSFKIHENSLDYFLKASETAKKTIVLTFIE